MVQAKMQWDKDRDAKRAYFVAWLIAPHVKKPPTPADILKPLYGKSRKLDYEAESKALAETFKDVLEA